MSEKTAFEILTVHGIGAKAWREIFNGEMSWAAEEIQKHSPYAYTVYTRHETDDVLHLNGSKVYVFNYYGGLFADDNNYYVEVAVEDESGNTRYVRNKGVYSDDIGGRFYKDTGYEFFPFGK